MKNHEPLAATDQPSTNPRRAQIIAQAARLFAREGYHLSSMNDIAAAAGIRKATLYHYFTSKAEILYTIHDEFMDLLLDGHAERQHTENGWEPLLRGAIRDIIQVTMERRGHIRVAIEYRRELAELPEELQTQLAAKRSRHYNAIRDLLQQGVEEQDLETVPTTATFAIMGMAFWTYQWVQPTGDLTSEDLADRMFALVIDGARTSDRPRTTADYKPEKSQIADTWL